MSLWPRLKAALFGGGLTNPDDGHQSSGPASYNNEAGISVSDERALAISAVWACVRLITQSAGTMPLGFYRRTAEGREALPEDHQLVNLLKYRPNLYMSGKEFRQAMFMSRALWGNAYARKRYSAGRLVSLVPLKPAFMEVKRTNSGLLYCYSTDQGVQEFTQRDIMHLRGPSPDGIMGLSPLGYMRHTLGITVSSERKAATSFAGRPSGTLSVDGWPNQEQRAELRDMYGNVGTDATGDGQWWLLPGGMKYQSISMPPDDLQLLESRSFQVAEIARYYGVPSVMIDGSTGATAAWPASYEQQLLSFLQFSLKPYLEEFEDAVTSQLLDNGERRTVYVEHKVDGLLRTDSETRANFYASMLQNGVYSRNEVRRMENLPPIDGGDKFTVQLNLTDIADLPDMSEESDDASQQISDSD